MSVWNALTELWRSENRRRGYSEVQDADPLRRRAVEAVRATGTSTARTCTSPTSRSARWALKPMNCPAHIQIYDDEPPLLPRPAGPLLRARPGAPPRALAACCTGCCACATSPRTTRTSSAPRSRSRRRSCSACASASSCYELFGFEPRLELSTRPEKRIGSDEMWDRAEGALAGALDAEGLEYELNPGDGAFYGPKIDMHMTDSLGRSWQLGTVQLDYSMPERFELHYTGADNEEHRPVMIHRALFGSFERFIGILIEHYARRAARCGWRRCRRSCCRSPTASTTTAARSRERLRERRRCASSSTSAASRSGARSARPSCARSPTCSSSASASRSEGAVVGARAPRRRRSAAMRRDGVRRAAARASYTRRALKPAQILRAPRLALA